MEGMITRLARLAPLLPPLAAMLLVLAERAVPATAARPFLSGAGVALLLLAFGLALSGTRLARSTAEGTADTAIDGESVRTPRWLVALPAGLFLLAAALYFAGVAAPGKLEGGVDWAALLGWGWALAAAIGLFPYLFVEAYLWSRPRDGRANPVRLRRAVEAGLFLGLLLCLVATLNFVFDRLPWQWDVAYFKTAEPSVASREAVEGLAEPVEVASFFDEDQPAGGFVRDYFRQLGDGGARLAVSYHDAELSPARAAEFKARGNGRVVVRKGEVVKEITIGTQSRAARVALKKFDATFLATLLEVSSERRVAYLTVGHGERNEREVGAADRRRQLSVFRSLLAQRNLRVKPLGAAEGLGHEVPADAALLAIIDPSEPFQAGEARAVGDYLKNGGRLLLFLDPESARRRRAAEPPEEDPLSKVLASHGLRLDRAVQANDRFYARHTFTDADRTLLVTIGFQGHPSVEALRREPKQNPLLLLGSGAWQKARAPAHLRVRPTIIAMEGTWSDRNGNFALDEPDEQRGTPALAMAVSPARPRGGKEDAVGPRILAFADADIAGDLLMQNRANQLAMAEGLRWVLPGPGPVGLPSSEEDVRIRHAKADDLVWFYLPVFGVPLLVLAFGYWRVGAPSLRWRRGHGA